MADSDFQELPTSNEWLSLRTDHAKLRIAYMKLYKQHIDILEFLRHSMNGQREEDA